MNIFISSLIVQEKKEKFHFRKSSSYTYLTKRPGFHLKQTLIFLKIAIKHIYPPRPYTQNRANKTFFVRTYSIVFGQYFSTLNIIFVWNN